MLGNARDRLTDEDNPPTKDELLGIQQRIEDAAPFAVQSTPDVTESPPDTTLSGSAGIKPPPIGG